MTEPNSTQWDADQAPAVGVPDPGREPPIDDVDPQVESKAIEIEQTRAEMTGTVEAIGDRLDPGNIAAGAKNAVREATVGKVEDMTSQVTDLVGDATDTFQDAGGGLVEVVRRNPVPALMVGAGLGWLWMKRNQASSGSRDAGRYGNARYAAGPYAMDRADWNRSSSSDGPSAASQVGDRVGDISDAVGQQVGAAGRRAGELGDQFSDSASDMATTTRQVVEDNVLAAGVAAAAAGLVIGLLLPATDTERRVMGDAGSRVIDAAQSTASEAMSNAKG
jgi:ElaB/YqjD/DUF883 family membrane-anchored ribosome-binding protein